MFFGTASYALYLFHPLTAPLAPEMLKRIGVANFPVSVLFSVIIAMTASAAIHRWFEYPLTRALRNKSRANIVNRATKTK